MRNIIKLAVVSSLVTFGAFQTHAAGTNEVHGLVIGLTVVAQGDTTTNGNIVIMTVDKSRLADKDLISLLNGLPMLYTDASNNVVVTNITQFSSKAALVLKVPKHNNPGFFIRDFIGTTRVDYDLGVSNYMNFSSADISARSSRSNTNTNAPTQITTSTDYLIDTVTFDNTKGTSFSVSGMLTVFSATIKDPVVGFITVAKTANGTLAGTGTVSGTNAVISGSIAAGSAKIEVD